MKFLLIPDTVVAEAITELLTANAESAPAQALADWIDINAEPSLAAERMTDEDAVEFERARR